MKKNNKGFTLIEIIIAIGLIVAIGVSSVIIFTRDNSDEAIKREEKIISAATVFTDSSSVIDINILEETGRTFITVGQLIDDGYLSDDVIGTKDDLGNEIVRDTKIAVFVEPDNKLLYYSFNSSIKESLVIVKEDKTIELKKDVDPPLKVKDLVYNKYLRAYDSENKDVTKDVTYKIYEDKGNNNLEHIEKYDDKEVYFDTKHIKNYIIKYSYSNTLDGKILTAAINVKVNGTYTVNLDIENTNKPNGQFNKGDNVELTIEPTKNYIYDSENFTCKDNNSGNNIDFQIANNIITIENINTDIVCTGAYKKNVRYINFSVTNGSIAEVTDGINSSNKVEVIYNKTVKIKFNPLNQNYINSTVTCNNKTYSLSNNVLTLSNVTSDMTCNVTFSIPTYSLYISVSNGTYNGKTSQYITLNKGDSKEFNITPTNGYIYDRYSCSTGVTFNTSNNKLSVTNIDSNQHCYIYYMEDNLYTRVSRKIYNRHDPVYIKYGNYTWIAYDLTYDNKLYVNGIKMILDRTAGTTSFSKEACCDTGVCTYENNNFINNYIGTVLKNFYNGLPSSRSSVLIESTYDTGYYTIDYNWNTLENHTGDRTATSVIGMIEGKDVWIITNYEPFYENTYDKFTWTTSLAYQYGTTYGLLGLKLKNKQAGVQNWNVYELVNTSYFPGYYFYSQKGYVYPPDKNYYYRPVIVMDKNVKVKSGEGTKANPYVVE